ncbi:MAG: amidohydrolase family protein [Roseburia sp.]
MPKENRLIDALEHYIRDEHFAGAKLQSLNDRLLRRRSACVDPVAEICEKYGKPLFIHSGHPPFSLPWQIGLLAERHPHLPIVMIHMGHAHGVYVDAANHHGKKIRQYLA